MIAAGCGTGLCPVAPGTAASLVALASGAALLAASPFWVLLAGLAATLIGCLVLRRVRVEGDPGWVVIDEFAGQWLALATLTQNSIIGLTLAFTLFRALDILKPGPIGWADRHHGVFGIMMDDVIAGVIVAAVLLGVRLAWPALGL